MTSLTNERSTPVVKADVLPRFGQEGGTERRGRALFRQPRGTSEQRLMPFPLVHAEPEKIHEVTRCSGVSGAEVTANRGTGFGFAGGVPFGLVPVLRQLFRG